MVKQLIEPHGTVIAIGIKSDKTEEIEQRFNSFWNFGATSSELIWKDWDFAYFWTTPQDLEHYLVNSSLHKILNENPNGFKGKKGGVMAAARTLAQVRRESDFEPTNCLYDNEQREAPSILNEYTIHNRIDSDDEAPRDFSNRSYFIKPLNLDFGANTLNGILVADKEGI